jgi:hypothetical protein
VDKTAVSQVYRLPPTRVLGPSEINRLYLLELYRGVTSSFFGIGILLVSDLLDFRFSVGIDPPFFVYFPPFLPPFFPKGLELLKKGAIAPLLRKKGGTAPFLIPKCTDRIFLRYRCMVNTEKYRPNTDRKYRIDIQL